VGPLAHETIVVYPATLPVAALLTAAFLTATLLTLLAAALLTATLLTATLLTLLTATLLAAAALFRALPALLLLVSALPLLIAGTRIFVRVLVLVHSCSWRERPGQPSCKSNTSGPFDTERRRALL
jgi:hypothetical protein